jgi:hypothetical protein
MLATPARAGPERFSTRAFSLSPALSIVPHDPPSMCVYIFSRRRERTEKPSSTSSRRYNESEDAPLSRAPLHVHYVLGHASQRLRLFYVCDNYSSRAMQSTTNPFPVGEEDFVAARLPLQVTQRLCVRSPLEADFVCLNSKARLGSSDTRELAQLFLNVHVDTTKKFFHLRTSLLTGTQSDSTLALGDAPALRNEIIRFVVLHPRYSLLEIMDAMDMFDIAYESQLAHRSQGSRV